MFTYKKAPYKIFALGPKFCWACTKLHTKDLRFVDLNCHSNLGTLTSYKTCQFLNPGQVLLSLTVRFQVNFRTAP